MGGAQRSDWPYPHPPTLYIETNLGSFDPKFPEGFPDPSLSPKGKGDGPIPTRGDLGMSQSASLMKSPLKIGSPSRKRCSGCLRNFSLTTFLRLKIP